MTGDTSPDLAPLPSAAAVVRYMRATGWTHGRQGSYGALWTRGDVSFAVPHEDDRPSWLREVIGRLASAEGRTPEATAAAIAAHRGAPLVMSADEFAAVKAVAEACGPQVARGAEVDAAGSSPDDSDRGPLSVHGHAQERTGPSSPEREAWDRDATAIPAEWVRVAEGHYSMHGAGLIRNILAGVAPLIRADERKRAERAEARLAEVRSVLLEGGQGDATARCRAIAITGTGEAPRPKLVRDKIPALIRSQGLEPVTRTAADGEMPALLRDKLAEEAAEYAASGDPAELADILEVLHALAGLAGISAGELERLRAAKERERGGFAGRVVWTANREPGTGEETRDA